MRLILINIFAVMIALSSVLFVSPQIESHLEQLSGIHQSTSWETDSLRNSELRHSEKTLHIAQNFIPIVVIAESRESFSDFIHYLPIYSLARQKEYFLLI